MHAELSVGYKRFDFSSFIFRLVLFNVFLVFSSPRYHYSWVSLTAI